MPHGEPRGRSTVKPTRWGMEAPNEGKRPFESLVQPVMYVSISHAISEVHVTSQDETPSCIVA